MERLKYQLSSLTIALMHLSVLLIFFSIFFIFPAHAADVTAPSQNKSYKLTVKNIGSVDMKQVIVQTNRTINPYGLIKVTDPVAVDIPAGGNHTFDIKF